MNNQVIISDYLLPLKKHGVMGKVHSVFEHSFNLAVAGHLINISSYTSYLSSFGIYLPIEQYETVKDSLQIGSIVKLNEDEIVLYSKLGVKKINLMNKKVYSLKVKKTAVIKSELVLLKKVFNSKNLINRIGIPLTPKTHEIFKLLSCESNENQNWEQIVAYLVGRGKGLTPSGDDILMSYLLVMSMFGQASAEGLSSALAARPLSTTDISRSYIYTAMDDYVNLPSFCFYKAVVEKKPEIIINQAVDNILKIGHTSGSDMAFGMLMAIENIINAEDF